MQTYTYAPTKGTLAGRRFEVTLYDIPSRPKIADYLNGAPDTAGRILYHMDTDCYYASLHAHHSIEIAEMTNKSRRRVVPSRSDVLHTFEKICRKFAHQKIQECPGNKDVSLVSLLNDTAPKTF